MTEAVTQGTRAHHDRTRFLRRRHAAERRFRRYGVAGIMIALAALIVLLSSMVIRGYGAFTHTYLRLEVDLAAERIAPADATSPARLAKLDYRGILRRSLRARFPEVRKRRDKRALSKLLSIGATDTLRAAVLADPGLITRTMSIWVPASDDVDLFFKGGEDSRSATRLDDKQIAWLDRLAADGAVSRRFNTRFFTAGDSREPEMAGIWGATVGSFLTLLVTLVLAFPLGVATAVYLEEFAATNRWTEFIEVNINNLAAVPSIVFGLLGLEVFLNVMDLPRSAPLVGGLVLALMTLPTLIIAGRSALQAVPPSIREAALGVGASKVQMVMHHVLPLAMPGILTGTIIGMARALGETAPLLMIGMVAFIVDIPHGINDSATVLPVQIYLWADNPERAFVEKTAAATLVLLVFLIAMNGLAVYLRKKFERRF